ncbi:uncharacterized protein LY89DRAFT_664032 [Mollisia scopiformis]|uniref:F-box domain-containing protein n=1 Tax=Mollisia scopiformis TaxID=149040 RepID=A0A194XUB6_MOLSC|nr:uncharacterized protein LY89DRAFT_664032 [Mollisia scopiformis]KUJ23629.1 hypothetical protein LY89DRAFT_664032 [Mollisia scopiformis]
MESLPGELLSTIFKCCEIPELLNLRQSCKAFHGPATRELFSSLHVIRQSDIETYDDLYSILSSSHISPEVTYIKITTSPDPYKEKDDYDNSEEESEFTENFEAVIQSISKFPNVQDVAIEFAQVCMLDDDPENVWRMMAEESVEFREDVLRTLFETLDKISKLRSLSIKHLQNYNDERILSLPAFASVLSRISDLKLKIVTESDFPSPQSGWNIRQLYSFFEELPDTWLKHTQDNLSSLTLDVDIEWGYMPVCNFRSLFFPRLKKLKLANYVFTHDWQLDWILSHETLEELVLTDCAIVNYMHVYEPLDAENCPLEPTNDFGDVRGWEYPRRWSEMFTKIEGMPNLRVFKFGSGNRDEGCDFDTGELTETGLHYMKYKGFHRRYRPSPWIPIGETTDVIENGDIADTRSEGENTDRMIESLDKDTLAYEKLMKTVMGRA